MKTISSFALEKTLIAGLMFVFMATAVLADEESDKRKADTDKAVDYLFGLNSASMPKGIMHDKFKEEFDKKAEQYRKYKARLLEKKVEYNRRDDFVWMHLIFTRTKYEPDMWIVLTAYFLNDKIESIQMISTFKEAPGRAF